MTLYIVTGSPGCGKSTWVRNNTKPGDIRFDSDALTNLLTGKTADKHHHDNLHKKISHAARDAGIAESIKHRLDLDIYILKSNLSQEDERRYRSLGAKFIIIDPGYETAMQRCRDHRPGYKQRLVDAWYDRRAQWPADAMIISPHVDPNVAAPSPQERPVRKKTSERGYGWAHQKQRDRLLHNHTDGSPCWWCGLPMYRDKTKNWDGNPLAADHDERDGAKQGSRASRLLHGNCNGQAQGHENDHRRPAVTGRHPSAPLPPTAQLGTVLSPSEDAGPSFSWA